MHATHHNLCTSLFFLCLLGFHFPLLSPRVNGSGSSWLGPDQGRHSMKVVVTKFTRLPVRAVAAANRSRHSLWASRLQTGMSVLEWKRARVPLFLTQAALNAFRQGVLSPEQCASFARRITLHDALVNHLTLRCSERRAAPAPPLYMKFHPQPAALRHPARRR